MTVEFFGGCERLLSATANGVYQGMFVAAFAGLALRLFGGTNAATRHAVWFGVFLFVAALIPAHLLLSFLPDLDIPVAFAGHTTGTTANSLPLSHSGDMANQLASDADSPDPRPDESDAGGVNTEPPFPGANWQNELATGAAGSMGRPGSDATKNAWRKITSAVLEPFTWKFKTAINVPHSICLCLASAWVLLACARGGLIAGRLGGIRHAKTTSNPPSERLLQIFDGLRRTLATNRNVQLRISTAHRTAVVLGFLHPVVLLPAEMDAAADGVEVEHVLRHELAHVGRRDDWVNLVQQLVQAALFFHPAIWWISARLSLEREIACDDHVLEASARPRAYALTLANVASRMNHCRQLLAPGVSNNNSQLQQRITMILNTQRNRSPRLAGSWLGAFTTATALLAVLALGAGPRIVLAQSLPVNAAAPDRPSPALPPTPEALLADTASVALPPDLPEAESGPRHKPSLDDDDPALPVAAAPATTAAPSIAPAPAAAPVPPAPPASPAQRASKRHLSVEERLDRIERMLDDLEAHGKARSYAHAYGSGMSYGGGASGGSGGGGMAYTFSPPINSLTPPAGPSADYYVTTHAAVDVQKATEEARRAREIGRLTADQAKRAVEEGERALKEGQRALEEGQRAASEAARNYSLRMNEFERAKDDPREADTEGSRQALEALREARGTLETQIKNIQRQIKRLEEDRNHSGTRGRIVDDNSDGKPEKPEPPKAP